MDGTLEAIRRTLWRAGRVGLCARELARRNRAFRDLSTTGRAELLREMERAGLCTPRKSGRATVYVDAFFTRAA